MYVTHFYSDTHYSATGRIDEEAYRNLEGVETEDGCEFETTFLAGSNRGISLGFNSTYYFEES